ncbi:MAG: uracil-DNA glycosylase [Candidatus Binatia bacterium]|nr:uracil-DNA glycosylase [Candidatus Binatia bacterium]
MPFDPNRRDVLPQPTLGRLAEQVRAHLQYWMELGEKEILRLRPTEAREQEGKQTVTPRSTEPPTAPPAPAAPTMRSLFSDPQLLAARTLDDVRAVLGDCRRCKLCSSRTQIVFGVGNPRAELMFVGEGPGRDEDLQGEPFVGRAGQLLTEIITKGMKMRRVDVYIANVVKCRPPDNRNPEPDEVAQCLPFLQRQIEIVSPRVIVALGKVAAHALLQTTTPISRLRGQWHTYRGIPLMPTLHPAYLLRNPADKRLVWEDIKQVIRQLRSP